MLQSHPSHPCAQVVFDIPPQLLPSHLTHGIVCRKLVWVSRTTVLITGGGAQPKPCLVCCRHNGDGSVHLMGLCIEMRHNRQQTGATACLLWTMWTKQEIVLDFRRACHVHSSVVIGVHIVDLQMDPQPRLPCKTKGVSSS